MKHSIRCQCRTCHPEVPAPVEAVFETTIRFYATGADEESVSNLKMWIHAHVICAMNELQARAKKTGRKVDPDTYDALKQMQE